MDQLPAVYIITNKPYGTLYTGVTSCLARRIREHRNHSTEGFSSRYFLKMLVYFEVCETMYEAISREKQIKSGSRKRKIDLIQGFNPGWQDMYQEICQ